MMMIQDQFTKAPKEAHVATRCGPGKARNRSYLGVRPSVVRSRACTDQPQRGCILAALDFSESSRKALGHACILANRLGCRLVLLHVVRRSCGEGLLRATRERVASIKAHFEAMQQLEAMVPCGNARLPSLTCIVRHGLPEYEIVRAAEDMRPDLLILGHRVRNPLCRALFGSVFQDVVDVASCPVLVVSE